ncbi:MAG: hypothetical protein ACYSOR_04640 [Planctomycetota bacterium]|jgi:hypothetical protein
MAAVRAAAGAKHAAKRAEQHADLLEANLAKSLMISEALWELLAEKTGLTENDLLEKLHEVDMRDGVLDGNNQRSAAHGPACGRKVSGRHAACLYCGEIIDKSVFDLG